MPLVFYSVHDLELLEGRGIPKLSRFPLVSHLDPTRESLLTSILAKRTGLTVVQPQDGTEVAPDHLYVIPPDTVMTLCGSTVRLGRREAAEAPNLPINALFESLACERADRSVCVILSGSGSDGARGAQAIKEAAGIVIVQDPASSRYRGMPDVAIATGCVDLILAPAEIGRELARIARRPYVPSEESEGDDDAGGLSAHTLRGVFGLIQATFQADFSQYKKNTIHRRLRRRMTLRHIDELADYVELLHQDRAELAALYDDLLIRVTCFFRDPDAFEALKSVAFPAILAKRTRKEPIRIWVPGCASGEEVYSIAVVLLEFLGEQAGEVPIQIFGSDLSEAAIDQARAARYPEIASERISAERLERFFVPEQRNFRVAKWVRQMCLFARHNVVRDPPFAHLDLVSCCNLLIYLNASAQQQVMRNLHYGLKPHGVLSLGPADHVGIASPYFEQPDPHFRFYARRPRAGRALLLDTAISTPVVGKSSPAEAIQVQADPGQVQRRADGVLLARFGPPSLLVDSRMNVVHFRGHTGPYVEHASGAASLSVHRVVKAGILVPLLVAIKEARDTNRTVHRRNLRVEGGDRENSVDLEVIPIEGPSAASGSCLILFDPEIARRGGDVGREAPLSEAAKDVRLFQLENEVADMGKYVESVHEAHEAAEEQAHAALAELLSTNEEFQSSNEELEITKEELQSANEELTTTNEELLHRNGELGIMNQELSAARNVAEAAQSFADAIIDTVTQPLLVLDSQLIVLRANNPYYEKFRAVPSKTIGLPLIELETGLWKTEALSALLRNVLRTNAPVVDHRLDYDLPQLGLTTLSLNARKLAGSDERGTLVLLAIEVLTEDEAIDRTADRRKDEFLAMLAHEIRNPLAPISNALHLLGRSLQDELPLQLVHMIGRQVRIMSRLVDDLLDISRITRGLITLNSVPLDLRNVLTDSVAAMRPLFEQRSQDLSLVYPDEPFTVDGDSVRLEQIFGNLLNNAGKYTDAGGRITVTIAARNHEAVVAVKDTGIGIAHGLLPHIFDLFMQARSSSERAPGGLGIGLTLVRRLVELHGGSVSAASRGTGQGSEFEVRLPFSTRVPPPASAEQPASPPPTAGPKRVLIADDNVDAADSLVQLVRVWGHEPACANDGSSALEIARGFQPDVGLLDIGMPVLDGYALARAIRKVPGLESIYLIAISGYGQSRDREAALEAGFDAHLVKPFAVGTLQTLLATYDRKAHASASVAARTPTGPTAEAARGVDE